MLKNSFQTINNVKGGVEGGPKAHLQLPLFLLVFLFIYLLKGINFQEHSNQHLHFPKLMKSCKFEE